MVNSSSDDIPTIKSSRSREMAALNWNYKLFNYCILCKIKYPKTLKRCEKCKTNLRTKPRWKRPQ